MSATGDRFGDEPTATYDKAPIESVCELGIGEAAQEFQVKVSE